MAFKKRNYRKTYPRKRKTLPNIQQSLPRRIFGLANQAMYAYKTVNMLKGIINSELHKHDHSVSEMQSSTFSMTLLSDINQGDDYNNRSGNVILGKYMTIKALPYIHSSATASNLRLIFFVDTGPNGTTPTATELLTTPTSILSPLNPDYSARFTVLRDVHFALSINGNRTSFKKFYIPLNFHLRFVGATGSTDYDKNSIWMYAVSDEATNTPTNTVYARICFYDN